MPRMFAGGVLVLLLASSAAAQGTGAIVGTVEDDTGGVLPGVTVTAAPAGTARVLETVTDSLGAYRFDGLPAGRGSVTMPETVE